MNPDVISEIYNLGSICISKFDELVKKEMVVKSISSSYVYFSVKYKKFK